MAATAERKDFAANKQMKAVMGKYFAELGQGAAEGKKTAWCTSVGPAELLRSLGFNVYFPENHGAMIGASKMGVDLCEKAETMGYSNDLCSYARIDLGTALDGVLIYLPPDKKELVYRIRLPVPDRIGSSNVENLVEDLIELQRHPARERSPAERRPPRRRSSCPAGSRARRRAPRRARACPAGRPGPSRGTP